MNAAAAAPTSAEAAAAALPRWFWLLPLLAIAAWWPLDPYWQSDDYLALHYAREFGHVLHDFVGPQYSATDIWFFYRPLITLSFWLDGLLGGGTLPVSMYSNVLAHGASALLVGLLWRRWLGTGRGFAAGLCWALLPSHLAALAWGVGRVDSHTVVWCLLTLWLVVRSIDGRGLGGRALDGRAAGERVRAWPVVLATAAALASKELAFALPPLATLLAFAAHPGLPLRERLVAAARASRLPWLVLVLYLPLRYVALGKLGGGYMGASLVGSDTLPGLGHVLADLTVPLRWCGELPVALAGPSWLPLAAATLPVLAAVLLALLRAPRTVLGAAVAFALATGPVIMFVAGAQNPHNLRYFYFASAALAGVLVAGGRWFALPLLLAWALPLVLLRGEQRTADRQSAAMHHAMLREVQEGAESPLFVAGLPHANHLGTTVQLHFGIDRMLAPPFGDDRARLYALRPLVESPDVFRLTKPGELPFALPLGSTWFFADATALGRAPVAPLLPELVVAGDVDGVFDLSTPRLDAMLRSDLRPRLSFPGVRPTFLRLTLFTANGYLCTICSDHGEPTARDGTFDVYTWVQNSPGSLRGGRIARAESYIGDALLVPTTIDRVPEFPVLLEAGTLSGDPSQGPVDFVPQHRARRLLVFRFDRGYPGWVRRAQGQ